MTVRPLSPSDEDAFQRLLRAVYESSYSYKDLYRPGGLARLLSTERVLSLGDFDAQGELFSHSAFLLKDPLGDYVESGMSLRDARRRGPERTPDAEIWLGLLDIARAKGVYLHQNTTMWHVLAQRYAERYMHARPTGFLADYVVGEKLVGISTPDTPMQALTMTTVLKPEKTPVGRTVMLPDGPFTDWLAEVFARWERKVIPLVERADRQDEPLDLETFEQNPWIDLRRRVVKQGLFADLSEERPRTDLLHVPADHRAMALSELLRQHYLPVGIRLQVTRPDEIVLQYLPPSRRPSVLHALQAANVHGPEAQYIVTGWSARCARIT